MKVTWYPGISEKKCGVQTKNKNKLYWIGHLAVFILAAIMIHVVSFSQRSAGTKAFHVVLFALPALASLLYMFRNYGEIKRPDRE